MKTVFYILTAVVFSISTLFVNSAIADDKEGGKKAEEGQKREGPRDEGKPGEEGKKDKGAAINKNSKEAKVFRTYDKDASETVTADEIVAMMEGKQNSRGRREVRKAVDRADRDEDGVLSLDEFVWWYQVGRLNEREKNR